MIQFFKNTLKAFAKSTVRRKLIDITDKDAIAAARIAGVRNNISIERQGGKDNGYIIITDTQINRSVRIYFNGSNTRCIHQGAEVIEYCYEIYSFLKSIGYYWKY